MSLMMAFLVSFVYVGTRAFQQLNVQHGRFRYVMPTSMVMAVCEATIIVQIVNQGLVLALPIGIGAGFGCMGAMLAHSKLRKGSK